MATGMGLLGAWLRVGARTGVAESLYGSVKMWAHLRREGIEVARCTVERVMPANGWQGVRRVTKVRNWPPSEPAGTAGAPTSSRRGIEADRAAARGGMDVPGGLTACVCWDTDRAERWALAAALADV